MAKFHGKVGFIHYEESEGSVYKEAVTEKMYYGDVLRVSKRSEPSDKLTDDISLNNEISIMADKFGYDNFQYIRYVNYLGANWKVTSATIEPDRPRITLQIGGVYNGSEGPET